MSILIDRHSKIVVCGITGQMGRFHTQKCLAYGSQIVAGVNPDKGRTFLECDTAKIPIFCTVAEAREATKANVALIFVPPAFATDSIFECIEAEIPLVIAITEGIPVHDMVRVKARLARSSTRLIGPNGPGVLCPGKCNASIMPTQVALPGRVGIVSKSGTLTYEAMWQLSQHGIGQSTCVGIGGDPITGTSHSDVIKLFNEDPETDAIVMIGEIGGLSEVQAAEYVSKHGSKPLVAFIAGSSAPKAKRMGHAGAMITGNSDTAAAKIAALRDYHIPVAELPSQIAQTLLTVYRP
ncbi:MAG: succinate--CoA ligase subunit alpha [Opitutales bacterium]|nr:succinate--CoA ligase subunit alpha [Opitutales bacterium]